MSITFDNQGMSTGMTTPASWGNVHCTAHTGTAASYGAALKPVAAGGKPSGSTTNL